MSTLKRYRTDPVSYLTYAGPIFLCLHFFIASGETFRKAAASLVVRQRSGGSSCDVFGFWGGATSIQDFGLCGFFLLGTFMGVICFLIGSFS
jgi:hypothetical protein